MTEDELNKRTEHVFGLAKQRMKSPWTEYQAPFKVIENVYFVGTKWVSAFLIDTPEGLVLIDCAYKEVFYQLVDSIHRLGFDPRNIKHLLLTHGHFDHCGAAKEVQEMSGCEIWIGKDDAYFFTERRDLIAFEDAVGDFKINHYYDYEKPIEFGGMVIRPVHCAGHTPGTTCFFFDVEHEGKKLTCAIHGGLGSNGMSRIELKQNGWPETRPQEFVNNLMKMKEMPVDVVLPSHEGHAVDYRFFELAAKDDGSGNAFIDTGAWKRMLESKMKAVEAIIASDASEDTEH